MSNPSKQKGTRFETEVAGYLSAWFPVCERRALTGILDRGDIAGIPNWVVECKSTNTALWGPFMDETEKERRNAGADFGLLVVKRRMRPVSRAFAVLPLEDMVALMCLDVLGEDRSDTSEEAAGSGLSPAAVENPGQSRNLPA